MSKYVISGGKYSGIRVRENTHYIVVHEVPLEKVPASEADLLWELESKARDHSVNGHGVHFIITPSGAVTKDRPIELHGSVSHKLNGNAVFIRMPLLNGKPTERQEEELAVIMDTIEGQYENLGYKELHGWEVLSK